MSKIFLRDKAKIRLGTCNVWRFVLKFKYFIFLWCTCMTHHGHRNDVLHTDVTLMSLKPVRSY